MLNLFIMFHPLFALIKTSLSLKNIKTLFYIYPSQVYPSQVNTAHFHTRMRHMTEGRNYWITCAWLSFQLCWDCQDSVLKSIWKLWSQLTGIKLLHIYFHLLIFYPHKSALGLRSFKSFHNTLLMMKRLNLSHLLSNCRTQSDTVYKAII